MFRLSSGLTFALIALALAGCGGGSPDEDEVRTAVEGLGRALARQDADAVCRGLDRDGREKLAPAGSSDPGAACPELVDRAFVRSQVSPARRKRTLAARYAVADVNVDGDAATAEVGPRRQKLALRRESGRWRLSGAFTRRFAFVARASVACMGLVRGTTSGPLPSGSRASVLALFRRSAGSVARSRAEYEALAPLAGPQDLDLVLAPLAEAEGSLRQSIGRLEGRGDLDAIVTRSDTELQAALRRFAAGQGRLGLPCGTSPNLSPAGRAFRSRAAAVCRATDRAGGAVPETENLKVIDRTIRRVVAAGRTGLTRLSRLSPPPALAGNFSAALAANRRAIALLEENRQALAAGRTPSAANQREIEGLSYRANTAWARLGLRVCAGAF